MEKNILVEVNRMRELMGKSSLILEGEGDILKYIERIFASEGDDAIKSIVKTVDSEVDNALLVLNRKKSGKRVTKADLENAYRTLKTKIEPEKLVDNLISKNLLDPNFKNGINDIKEKATQGGLSTFQYEYLIDKYIDNAMVGVDDMTRNAFKKKFKSEIPQGMKNVERLTKDVLEQIKTQNPELFEMKWFGTIQKYPDQVKRLENQIKEGWKNSGLNKEQILSQIKKEGDDMISLLNKSKLSGEDKSKIIQWWDKKTTGGQIKYVLTSIVIITLIQNYIRTDSFWGAVGATAAEIGGETTKGFIEKTGKIIQGDTTQTTKPSEPIKSDTTKTTRPTLEL
jgi:hypothetical protein